MTVQSQTSDSLADVDRLILSSRVAGIVSAILFVIGAMIVVGDLWPPKSLQGPTISSPSS